MMMPTKFVTKSELRKLERDVNEKTMLNERDNILLSVAALLGLAFSIIQIVFGGGIALLVFVPLLIVGWVMPLLNYIYRVVRKLEFEKSLDEHFKGWIYLSYGLVFYMIASIALFSNAETWMLLAWFVSLIVLFTCVLHISGIRFFRLFEREESFDFMDIFFKGYSTIIICSILLLSSLFFYLTHVLPPHSPLAPPSFIAGLTFLAISFIYWGYNERVIKNIWQFGSLVTIVVCIAFILARFC